MVIGIPLESIGIHVCVAYDTPSGRTREFSIDDIATAKSVLETVAEWSEPIDAARSMTELPAAARQYCGDGREGDRRAGRLASGGADRGATVVRRNAFAWEAGSPRGAASSERPPPARRSRRWSRDGEWRRGRSLRWDVRREYLENYCPEPPPCVWEPPLLCPPPGVPPRWPLPPPGVLVPPGVPVPPLGGA